MLEHTTQTTTLHTSTVIANPFLRVDPITSVKSYYTHEFQSLPLSSMLAPYIQIRDVLLNTYKDLDYFTVVDIMDTQLVSLDVAIEVHVALLHLQPIVERAIHR